VSLSIFTLGERNGRYREIGNTGIPTQEENRKQHENWLKLLAYSLLGSAMSAAALMLNSTRFRVQKTR
jgi:hypothetical protein